jgi:hypothetical protein
MPHGGFVTLKNPEAIKYYTINGLHIKLYQMWVKCYTQNLRRVPYFKGKPLEGFVYFSKKIKTILFNICEHHNLLQNTSKRVLHDDFLNISAAGFPVETYSVAIMLLSTFSWTRWQSTSICFVLYQTLSLKRYEYLFGCHNM